MNIPTKAFAIQMLAATGFVVASIAGLSASFAGDRQGSADSAVAACLNFNDYGPAELNEVVDDGFDGYLVWVEDADGDLWMCDASDTGDIYANAIIDGDLFDGEGADILGVDDASMDIGEADAITRAERVCTEISEDEEASVIASADDGLGDYVVWVEGGDGDLTLCNASAYGEVFAFESIDGPLNGDELVG
jgi:hypothetical protein